MGILLSIGILILGMIVGWFILIRRYAEKLEWIRDRVDLTTEDGREIARYINKELDQVHGLRELTDRFSFSKKD